MRTILIGLVLVVTRVTVKTITSWLRRNAKTAVFSEYATEIMREVEAQHGDATSWASTAVDRFDVASAADVPHPVVSPPARVLSRPLEKQVAALLLAMKKELANINVAWESSARFAFELGCVSVMFSLK